MNDPASPSNKPIIYNYCNALVYVLDYIEYLRSVGTSKYSERFLADKLGIAKSSVHRLLAGQRKSFGLDLSTRIIKLFKLDHREALFFASLVHFSEANNTGEKDKYYSHMLKLVKPTSDSNIRQKYYSVLKEWYIPVLRELITMYHFDDDFETLATLVSPPISERKAKVGVELLESCGMIKKNQFGWYEQCDIHLSARSELKNAALLQHQHQVLDLNKKVLSNLLGTPDYKISTATFGLDECGEQELRQAIEDFRDQVISIAGSCDDSMNRVYQLNIGFFPVSKLKQGRSERPAGDC